MDVTKVAVQQLLRPTETCLFIIGGKVLGVQSHDDRVLTVVRHEGTQEHVLFVFEVNSMGQLQMDQFIPIHGSFSESLQSTTPSGCRVQIMTNEGSAVVFKLPYDSVTAKLFSVLKTARDAFSSSPTADSSSAFSWLKGYELCRTGWDRFSKPGHISPPLIDFGDSQTHPSSENGDNENAGFPDKWPWSYIITPRSDGSTDMAVCESLVDEFDPLLQQPVATVGSTSASDPSISFQVGDSSQNSLRIPLSHHLPHNDPFVPTNPFSSRSRVSVNELRCRSETNIASLEKESALRHSRASLHTSHSEEDLLTEMSQRKDYTTGSNLAARNGSPTVVIPDSLSEEDLTMIHIPDSIHGASSPTPRLLIPQGSPRSSRRRSLPRERPQGAELTKSGDSFQMDNPFQNQEDADSTGPNFSWPNEAESSIEMRDVDTEEEEKLSSKILQRNKSNTDVSRLEPMPVSKDSEKPVLDYNHRRMRSSTAIPTSSSAIDIQPKMPTRSSGTTSSSSLVSSRSPYLFRKKLRGHSPDQSTQSSWVTRYQPGVLLLQGNMRECLIQRMLQEREKDFCLYQNLTLFCGTWNVNGQQPMQRMDKFILSDGDTPDIFAIGFQELDLSTEAFVKNESAREELWINLVESSLDLAHKKYKRVALVRLVGIMLAIYAEDRLVKYITNIETDYVATGILGIMGNKGGVAVRFNVFHTSVCIVNCHLASGLDEVEKRNQDYHQIYNKISFFKGTSLPYGIMDHNAVVWMGDLNYRIPVTPEMTVEMIKAMADSYQTQKLLRCDQLRQQKQDSTILKEFTEPDIQFKPTYKYDPSTNSWDTSEKNRAPAWCDRILYFCESNTLTCQRYGSHPEMIISDHKPVSSLFDIKVKQVLPEQEKEVLEQITWELDKQENETLPHVTLNSLEFKFDDVKFMVPQVQCLHVRNIGQRPVQVNFLPTPDKRDAICLDWLSIKPSSAVILPNEQVIMELTLLVDMEVAPVLNTGSEKLEDILVLHLHGGKDFFISIIGKYLPSCFGSSLEVLVQLHNYAREVPTEQLLDLSLSSSWTEYDKKGLPKKQQLPNHDIPKELFQLVAHLKKKYAMAEETLFTDGGLTAEQERIRDILDTGGQELPGSVFSVAASLLTFLRSLLEPVVPHNLHQKCMDACNNPTLCKQLLMLMPTVHRRTFVFIITFLKQSLKHPMNKMDAKLLASIFGDVLLTIPPMMRKTASRKSAVQSNKKKAAFIYQFLVNDLTVSYK